MGDNPATSVTNADARFHIANAYALGPALQPTVGSPNPMLTSVALGRRLADHLIPMAPTPVEGPRSLFNGTDLDGWERRDSATGSMSAAPCELCPAAISGCCGRR